MSVGGGFVPSVVDGDDRCRVTAVVVTYKRPIQLAGTLASLLGQTQPPDDIVVVDNDPDGSARDASASVDATYLPTGENLGPSGGIAVGIRHVFTSARPHDRVVIIDDDDPLPTPAILRRLIDALDSAQSSHAPCAGVGAAGARYVATRGVFHRVADSELAGLVRVDYLGGNQSPVYSVDALRSLATVDSGYFFGFDDAHLGLALRRAGWSLVVPGDLWRERRVAAGQIGVGSIRRANVSPDPWRQFYSSRNSIHLAREFGTVGALVRTALRGAVVTPAHRLLTRGASLQAARASFRGTVAGLCGQLGRTVEPP